MQLWPGFVPRLATGRGAWATSPGWQLHEMPFPCKDWLKHPPASLSAPKRPGQYSCMSCVFLANHTLQIALDEMPPPLSNHTH